VLLARLRPLLSTCRRLQQSGFTAGRSTIDASLALRLLSELHHEFNQPMNVAYIDIKAEVVDGTREESIATQVQRRQLALFGHVRRLPDTVPANAALRLWIDARVGRRVDARPTWKRQRGRHRNTGVRRVEFSDAE